MEYKNKENFASFRINPLFNSDFGRKTRKSTTGPLPAATPSIPVLFALLLPTLGPSTQALVHIPIYLMQPPGTGLTLAAGYTQLPGTKLKPRVYMMLSGIELIFKEECSLYDPHLQLIYSLRAQDFHQQLIFCRAQDPHLPLIPNLQVIFSH